MLITQGGVNVPIVLVHFNSNKAVDFRRLSDGASTVLFNAANISAEEFAQAIVNNYDVNGLDPQPPSQMETTLAVRLGTTPDMHYVHEENNSCIDVHGKEIEVNAAQPQSRRFD